MGRIRKFGGALERGDIFKTPRLRRIASERGKTYTGSANPFYGKQHTKATLKQISETLHRQYASGERIPYNKGKRMSIEQRKKISRTMRGGK